MEHRPHSQGGEERRAGAEVLPPELLRLFWDFDAKSLRWERHQHLIIGRVLASGPWDTVQWLRRRLGDPALREWIERHQGRGLSPQQLRFWELVLGFRRGAVDAWLQNAQRAVWDHRSGSWPSTLTAWPETGCLLAAPADLACMKLSAIVQRGLRKDFIDLYALVTAGRSLTVMLEGYQEKFGVTEIGHLLYALSFFDDADGERMPRMHWKVSWPEVKRSIQGWVREASG